MKRLNYIVSLILIAFGSINAKAQAPNLWLKADGNLLDSASTNNGVLVDPISYTPGNSGQAFLAEGGAIRVTNSPDLRPASTVTVQALVKGTAPGAFNYIVSKSRSGFGSYAIYTGGGGVAFFVAKGAALLVSPQATAAAIWDNNWHQVTGVYDGTNVSLYIDGTLLGSSGDSTAGDIDYNTAANSGDLIIANLNPFVGAGNYYVGALDDVKIFSAAMSASDVSDTFNNPASSANTNALVAWYKGEGNLLDSWGSHHGTLVSPAVVSYFPGKSGQSILAPKGTVQIPNAPSFNASTITETSAKHI